MSLAFSVYNLTIDVDGALHAFAQIVDHLGLSNERVRVTGKNVRPGDCSSIDCSRSIRFFPEWNNSGFP